MEILIGVIVWLGLGGWAFRSMSDEFSRDEVVAFFIFSILLAPFAAGVAIAEIKLGKPKKTVKSAESAKP